MDGWGKNAGLVGTPGFFVKNGTYSWTNITSQFEAGSFSIAFSPTYSSNGRVKVYNGTFTASIGVGVVEFKEGFVYKYDMKPEPDAIPGTASIWIPDVTYNRPFITKANFRDGNFKGVWNTGLFGRQDKKIKWEGNSSTWNAGTLLNTEWEKGNFNTVFTLTQSWFTELDQSGVPIQKQNRPNNNGRSFNYVIDSEIKNSKIQNGIFLNTTIGSSTTYSVMENFLLNNNILSNNEIIKAFFENCTFISGNILNSEIKNSKATNTKFQRVKTINSDFKLSVIKDSTYISDDIVKIIGYDEFNMASTNLINGVSHKVYKFYIKERDFYKLKQRDRFYIKGVKTFNNITYPFNLFDRRFRVQTWTEYVDFFSGDLTSLPLGINPDSFYKRGIEVAVFLSTPEENAWKFNSVFNGSSFYTSVIATQSEKRYSVDIVISTYDKNSSKVEFLGEQNTYDIPISGLNYNYDQTPSGTVSLTMSNLIGNIVDISNAYILESDFESGILETSNWDSGYHINYNNDVNFTQNTIEGKYYNLQIQTSSATIIATTTYDQNFVEAGENCLSPGNVVFLHSIDYDTIGKVDGFTITASGSNYISSNGIGVSGGTGIGLTIDIHADTIGEVLSITYTPPLGSGYTDGQFTSGILATGSGTNLIVDYFISGGQIQSVTVSSGGFGFQSGNILEIVSLSTTTGTFSVNDVTYGGILAATVSTGGRGYSIGDNLLIETGSFTASIQVTSTTGSVLRLPEAYRITNNTNGVITMKEVTSTASILSTVLDQGIFYTDGAENRYGYIYKAKINKSKIKSGIFRRAFIKNSLIEDLNYDLADRDFTNLSRIKNLMLSDILFYDTGNILSSATYINSNIIRGSDDYKKGIIYRSIWKGGTFSEGVFENGTWMDGIFTGGSFYENRGFDANPGTFSEYYDKNNINTYIRDGYTSATISNNRISWMNGTFSSGEFYKSDWENGKFRNGKFYYSRWYNGDFYNGTIGDQTISSTDTNYYNGNIWNATVENAYLFAIDTSLYGLSNSTINWYNGLFNDGVFGSDIIQSTASHAATWWKGTFNGGEFKTLAKWKTGTFNNGKFTSKYGWESSTSNSAIDYGWESGIFNGGEFGVGDRYFSNYKSFYDEGNSTWFNGEFNGGVFKGRVWNNGIFSNGDFLGSATISVIAAFGTTSSTADEVSYKFRESGAILPSYAVADGINPVLYVSTNRVWYNGNLFECATASITTATPSTTNGDFTVVDLSVFLSQYYGLWRDGLFTNVKDKFIKNKKLFSTIVRNEDAVIASRIRQSKISNAVWQSGTFSHASGEMFNTVWWDGTFDNGNFRSSSFNPYVRRNSTSKTFNINDNTCYWENGQLNDSDFYISKWKQGSFVSGTGYGMIFQNGVASYMNAYNVFWENGTWRNGNWYGSNFDLSSGGIVTDDYTRQILFRGMSWSATSSTHVWNIFIEQNTTDSITIAGETASTVQSMFIVPTGVDETFTFETGSKPAAKGKGET
jgi:hypothetical protein